MYKIGITGSIGTGKSTVARMFSSLSIPIFDADKEIKKILERQKVKDQIKKQWPLTVKKNVVNKQELKSIIFSNKNEKRKLEKLLYPHLEKEKKKFENVHIAKNIVVYDVPLIYETSSQKNYDLILLTNCNKFLQKKRVLKRDKMTNSLFLKIGKTQLSFEEKIKYKPRVINTNNYKIFVFLEVFVLFMKILFGLKIKNERKKNTNT